MSNHQIRRRRYKSPLPSRLVKRGSRYTHTTKETETERTPEKTRQETSDVDHILGTSRGLNDMTPEGRQFHKAFNSFVFVVGFVLLSFVIMWAIGC